MTDIAPASELIQAVPPSSGPLIIGVRFMRVGKLYHFNATGFGDVRPGDRVIVETTRGRQLGDVVNFVPPEKQAPPVGGYKAIESVATARDLALEQMWKGKETEAMIDCRERAHQLGLHDVKIVRAETNLLQERDNTGILRHFLENLSLEFLYPASHVQAPFQAQDQEHPAWKRQAQLCREEFVRRKGPNGAVSGRQTLH